MKLSSKAELLKILKDYSITPLKQLGQNFLIDENMLRKIVEVSGAQKDDACLEVGPGVGSLTQKLAELCSRVVAVEIDKGMVRVLADTLKGYDNVEVLHEDILKADVQGIAKSLGDFRAVANLPYYISTAVIMQLCGLEGLKSMSLLVQKEVAERIVAAPNSKDYGILSVAASYYFTPQIVLRVPPDCFYPRPKVESSVIRLDKQQKQKAKDDDVFFKVVKAAFAQRRKTLLNNLSTLHGKDRAREYIARAGLNESSRAEQLKIEEFIALADLFVQEKSPEK